MRCLGQIGRELIGRQLHDDTLQIRTLRPAPHHPLPHHIEPRFTQHIDRAVGKRIGIRRIEQLVDALQLQNQLRVR